MTITLFRRLAFVLASAFVAMPIFAADSTDDAKWDRIIHAIAPAQKQASTNASALAAGMKVGLAIGGAYCLGMSSYKFINAFVLKNSEEKIMEKFSEGVKNVMTTAMSSAGLSALLGGAQVSESAVNPQAGVDIAKAIGDQLVPMMDELSDTMALKLHPVMGSGKIVARYATHGLALGALGALIGSLFSSTDTKAIDATVKKLLKINTEEIPAAVARRINRYKTDHETDAKQLIVDIQSLIDAR